MNKTAQIGIIGGSGFYSFLEEAEEVKIHTPYGPPSDNFTLGTLEGRQVAFLPRHGRGHRLPPHCIPYRANLWAFKELGVTQVISPCAAGSLQKNLKPGDFVLCDQFVDRTRGRKDTYFDGPCTTHVSTADPYCSRLGRIASEAAAKLSVTLHREGTMVVIQGPRFSTRAESRWFNRMGWSVVNMTGYPEAALARELEMCFVNISLITDYDAGLEGADGIEPVSSSEVVKVFNRNNELVKELIKKMIASMPPERSCACGESLKYAGV